VKVKMLQIHQKTDDKSVLEELWGKQYYIILGLTMVLMDPENLDKTYMSKGVGTVSLSGKDLEVTAGGISYEMEILEV